MYTNEMLESIKKVEANREANAALEPRRMTAEEKDALLRAYHPDYKEGEEFVHLAVGPNKGDKVPKELGALLQGKSRISPEEIDQFLATAEKLKRNLLREPAARGSEDPVGGLE